MRNSTAIRECDVDTVRIISIKGISKVGNSFLSDLGRPGKSYIQALRSGCTTDVRSWVAKDRETIARTGEDFRDLKAERSRRY